MEIDCQGDAHASTCEGCSGMNEGSASHLYLLTSTPPLTIVADAAAAEKNRQERRRRGNATGSRL